MANYNPLQTEGGSRLGILRLSVELGLSGYGILPERLNSDLTVWFLNHLTFYAYSWEDILLKVVGDGHNRASPSVEQQPGILIGLEILNNSLNSHSNRLGLCEHEECKEWIQLREIAFLSAKVTPWMRSKKDDEDLENIVNILYEQPMRDLKRSIPRCGFVLPLEWHGFV